MHDCIYRVMYIEQLLILIEVVSAVCTQFGPLVHAGEM